MGRASPSKVQARLEGRICCSCSRLLDPPPVAPGIRYCDGCEENKPRHRVKMNFTGHPGRPGCYIAHFLEADCKTALGRTVQFPDLQSMSSFARRGGSILGSPPEGTLETKAKNWGHGGVWLWLTPKQYRALW